MGVWRGASLYVGSLIGPGLLLVPALAVQAAGPASIIAWGLLLVLSVPLAMTFAALGVRLPVSGGVAAYVEEGFGPAAGALTGWWFLTAVLIGAPTVALVGGYYVADLTGSGTAVAGLVAVAIFVIAFGSNALGLRLSSRLQMVLVIVMTLLIAIAVAAVLPSHITLHWTPFAPHGWWGVGSAAGILVWLFVGWEAVAQLAGEFESAARQLPRAVSLAFVTVTVLYIGLAVATVTTSSSSNVPLADLLAAGFGEWARPATAIVAVALTLGTMNVYVASAAKLGAALAVSGALPTWLGRDALRSVPRRPLAVAFPIGIVVLAALTAGVASTSSLVKATSACFVAVYVAATASAVKVLDGRMRAVAVASNLLTVVVAAFLGWYLLIPAGVTGFFVLLRARTGGVPNNA